MVVREAFVGKLRVLSVQSRASASVAGSDWKARRSAHRRVA
jgi:hypothetical protein